MQHGLEFVDLQKGTHMIDEVECLKVLTYLKILRGYIMLVALEIFLLSVRLMRYGNWNTMAGKQGDQKQGVRTDLYGHIFIIRKKE